MRARTWMVAALVLAAGCGGGAIDGGDDGLIDGGPSPTPAPLTITSPSAGQIFTRDKTVTGGALAAPVMFAATAGPEVAAVEWVAEDVFTLGAADAPSYALSAEFRGDGDRFVVAHARAADGRELGTARVDFVVKAMPGTSGTCHQMLDQLGIVYTLGPLNKGVPDPVTVTTPINGVQYYAYGNATPRVRFFMDCTLAVALWRMADVLKPRGLTAIEDIGVYNYRCIGGGNPDTDNCTPSMHAQAKAIDIHEFRVGATTYNTLTDFVIDPDKKTCTAPTANDKDKWLHEAACELHTNRVWNIILTPNYNADHRNHFHVDLTPDSDFIERRTWVGE